jgi:hypothetical protein
MPKVIVWMVSDVELFGGEGRTDVVGNGEAVAVGRVLGVA